MRRRGLRRRRDFSSAYWTFCVPWVALALSLLHGFSFVHSSTRINHQATKVVGSTNLPVKVYVRQHHNSPHILCLTNHLRNSELIDPIFEWHGPSGDLVTGNESVTISPTGTLIFQHFKSYMSGIYTCSLVFKPTTEQEEKSYLIKYVIYAYSDPNFYYEFTARYHSAPCNSIYNASFEKKLLLILAKLVGELGCEVSIQKSECHHVKMQRAGMQNELFFTFKVSSLEAVKGKSVCQNSVCDVTKRVRKAKDLIGKFFSQQVEVLGKRTAPLPEIYYIEGTLQMVWINRCFPGYGINSLQHPDCPNCCAKWGHKGHIDKNRTWVVGINCEVESKLNILESMKTLKEGDDDDDDQHSCPKVDKGFGLEQDAIMVVCNPGTFNPHEGTHCLQCNRSLAYGAKHCY